MPEAKRQSLRYCLTSETLLIRYLAWHVLLKTFILMLCVPEENDLMTYIEIVKAEISNVDEFAHFLP